MFFSSLSRQDCTESDIATLIATCNGEKGLDITDVDLIICFDYHDSPLKQYTPACTIGVKRYESYTVICDMILKKRIFIRIIRTSFQNSDDTFLGISLVILCHINHG